MSPRGRNVLWTLILGGLVARLVLGFATLSIPYDLETFRLVAVRFHEPHVFEMYADLNARELRWAYPPGYVPWLLLSNWFANRTGVPFDGLVQVPPIVSDAALAWLVQAFLADRGVGERKRLAAAGLVAFGPLFVFVSGYQGQIDSAAIMPAVAALFFWERLPPGRRALVAGSLIALGASIKTVPCVVVLALLPRASGGREATALLVAAAALPLLLLAPWLIAEPGATVAALGYSGVPGLGGLSLLAQPSLAESHLLLRPTEWSQVTIFLWDLRLPVSIAVMAAVFGLLIRRRPEPAMAAVLVWLAVSGFAFTFGPRYVLWALPFMLMAGLLREVVVLQTIAFAAGVILITRPHDLAWLATLYTVLMLSVAAVFLVLFLTLASGRRRDAPAVSA